MDPTRITTLKAFSNSVTIVRLAVRSLTTIIETGIDIIRHIRGFTTGFAEPKYVLDTPYGKIPMGPQYMVGRDGEYWVLKSFEGKIWRELNPLPVEEGQQDG